MGVGLGASGVFPIPFELHVNPICFPALSFFLGLRERDHVSVSGERRGREGGREADSPLSTEAALGNLMTVRS